MRILNRIRSFDSIYMQKCFEESMSNVVLLKVFSKIIAFFVCINLLQKCISYQHQLFHHKSMEVLKINVIKVLLSSITLVVLPLIVPRKQDQKEFTMVVSGIALLASIIVLESAFGRRQCFVFIFTLEIFNRCLRYRSLVDTISLCVVYASNLGTLRNFSWYFNINMLVWSMFMVSWVFHWMHERFSIRIWQHLRQLLILKEKTQVEQTRAKALLNGYVHEDILQFVFPEKFEKMTESHRDMSSKEHFRSDQSVITGIGSKSVTSLRQDRRPFVLQRRKSANQSNGGMKESEIVSPLEFDSLAQEAIDMGLMPCLNYGVVSAHELSQCNSIEKQDSVVIAIRLDHGNANDCALMIDQEVLFNKYFDLLAKKFKVTRIRNFGNTWVYLLGFFGLSWGNDGENAFSAILFCAHIEYLCHIAGYRVSMAVDYGLIVGGFVQSLQFDLYGQEIRWVLQMNDLQEYGKVFISDSVKSLLNTLKRHGFSAHNDLSLQLKASLVFINWVKAAIELPWKKGYILSINSINSTRDLVLPEEFEKIFTSHENKSFQVIRENLVNKNLTEIMKTARCIYDKKKYDRRCAWKDYPPDHLQRLIDTVAKQNVVKRKNIQTAPSGMLFHTDENMPFSMGWLGDVGVEFQKSYQETFDCNLNDPCLRKYSRQDLISIHEDMKAKIVNLVRVNCFPDPLSVYMMKSEYKNLYAKEYILNHSAIPIDIASIPFTYQRYHDNRPVVDDRIMLERILDYKLESPWVIFLDVEWWKWWIKLGKMTWLENFAKRIYQMCVTQMKRWRHSNSNIGRVVPLNSNDKESQRLYRSKRPQNSQRSNRSNERIAPSKVASGAVPISIDVTNENISNQKESMNKFPSPPNSIEHKEKENKSWNAFAGLVYLPEIRTNETSQLML